MTEPALVTFADFAEKWLTEQRQRNRQSGYSVRRRLTLLRRNVLPTLR